MRKRDDDGPPPNLKPRKSPVQDRGKDTIRRIIDAAHRLLKTSGPAALTTPAIAAEAGLSVGSLYQYFPNKESVVLALYQRKLADIRELVGHPILVNDGDWKDGLRRWIREVKQKEAQMDFDLSTNAAMEHYPALRDVARDHAALQADVIAGHLKQLGSDWPDDALFDVAINAFFINSSTWIYWAYAGQALPQGIDRLAECAVVVLAPAVECTPPPPPPYAQRPARRLVEFEE